MPLSGQARRARRAESTETAVSGKAATRQGRSGWVRVGSGASALQAGNARPPASSMPARASRVRRSRRAAMLVVAGLASLPGAPLARTAAATCGTLVDKAAGGHPVHALLPEEVAVILDVTERWGAVDARIASWPIAAPTSQLVWVSPSSRGVERLSARSPASSAVGTERQIGRCGR